MAKKKGLDAVLANINKEYGEHTVQRASHAKGLSSVRIPTGIFSLDLGMGLGVNGLPGIPRGRLIMLKGDESSGKTTVAKRAVGQAQQMCRHCNIKFRAYAKAVDEEGDDVKYFDKSTGELIEDESQVCDCGNPEPMVAVYLDAEGTYDPEWASLLGVDNSRIILSQPNYAEQSIDVVEALLRTGQVDILVVDSIATLVPATEIEISAEKERMGLHARLMNRFMRLIGSSLNSLGMNNEQKPAIILINQKREKIGVMFGDNSTVPGGKGQQFAISIKVDLRRTGKIAEDGSSWSYKMKSDVAGNQITWKTQKNKTYPPHKKGSFTIYSSDTTIGYTKGEIDNPTQVIDLASNLGIIERAGSWYKYRDVKEQGMDNMVQRLLQDKVVYEDVERDVQEFIKQKLKSM